MLKLLELESYFISKNIPYEILGVRRDVSKFGSIKKIEDNCFFYVSGKDLPKEVNNSIILASNDVDRNVTNNTLILVTEPQLVFYKLMSHFCTPLNTGISNTALISTNANISSSVQVGDFTKIGYAKVGKNSKLGNNVIVHDNVIIGDNVIISDNTVIGAQGVAWIWDSSTGERVMQPQIGGVEIEDNVFIGSNVTIVRGSVNENTVIGKNSLISHGTQVGHGVQVSRDTHIANNCALAGNVVIGYECFIGAGSTLSSQIKVAPKVIIGAGATISKSIEKQGATYMAMPARAIPAPNNLNGVPKPK